MNNNNKHLFIAGIVILVLAFLLAMQIQRTSTIVEKTDTLTVEKWKHDTLKVDSIVPKYIKQIKTVHDTLRTTDSIPVSVEIPIQLAHYDTTMIKGQDTVRIWGDIEGYKPRLLSMGTIMNRREKETIVTHSVTKTKKQLITLSPVAGFGYGITSKKVDAFVGVGLAINL